MTPPPVRAVVLVVLGGALGGLARHGADVLVDGSLWPWSTFLVNLTGSALLAALPAVRWVRRRPLAVAALGPGLLGGYTTLSAYAEQVRALADEGHTGLAASYAVASVAACLAGVLVVRRLASAGDRGAFERAEGDA